ncbi:MAG: glutamyl-tRNA reductase [Flavobacteriales bacterium]|nr:glutamyl-tRNA reductase [Flavobacteriales bacterium]
MNLEHLHIIAFTHKDISLDEISRFHLEEKTYDKLLVDLKEKTGVEELMYLCTCNRVEFLVVTKKKTDSEFVKNFFESFEPTSKLESIETILSRINVISGEGAVKHLLKVASSLESLVVGEREIISQVRKAFEHCKAIGITGELIKLTINHAVTTAKEIYTKTDISRNPVSVVSLAYRKLKEYNIQPDARFLIIGAGETNEKMASYLKKHHFGNMSVFNRTFKNAERLAVKLKGKAFGLEDLKIYSKGFDVIITCTGSTDPIITPEIYTSLLAGESNKKTVVDLALPNDLDRDVLKDNSINLIDIDTLKVLAESNLQKRKKELLKCEGILNENLDSFKMLFDFRNVELAMKGVPAKVKEIKEKALSEVFQKEIEGLDDNAKEVLDRVMEYMEKKYISVPMKMAKDILVKPNDKKLS